MIVSTVRSPSPGRSALPYAASMCRPTRCATRPPSSLQSGTDLAVIALWLGHSSPAVTYQYLEADLATKEATLARLGDPSPGPARFQPPDRLLAFLEQL